MNRHAPAPAILLVALLTACPKPTPDPGPVSGFTDGPPDPPPVTEGPQPEPTLVCPGETQCPCVQRVADDSGGQVPPWCPVSQICGPTGACTKACNTDRDCRSGVSGESCVAGIQLCGVPCDPNVPDGGCGPSGMPGAVCVTVGPGDHYCGYEP